MEGPFDLGDSKRVEITSETSSPFGDLNVSDVDSISLTVEDPEGTEKVSQVSMTRAGEGQYYYVFDTSSSDVPGVYEFTAKAVKGSIEEEHVFEARYR